MGQERDLPPVGRPARQPIAPGMILRQVHRLSASDLRYPDVVVPTSSTCLMRGEG
jgi:hypothetical protein